MAKTILQAATFSAFLFFFSGMVLAQDFTVRITDCPKSAKAGQDLSGTVRVHIRNDGKEAVKNARVDVVLKKDATCPPAGRPAVYAPDYFDGVLLREGRHYVSLQPGEEAMFRPYGASTIPLDTPVGRTYFLCAVVAKGDGEKEGDKPGTCACSPIKIVGTEDRPEISGFAETCAAKGGAVTILGRNFGSMAGKSVVLVAGGINLDLSIISWGDGAIVVRVPDDARIQDGSYYQLVIRKSDQAELLSNWKAVSICAARKAPQAPVSVPPPMPPFLSQ